MVFQEQVGLGVTASLEVGKKSVTRAGAVHLQRGRVWTDRLFLALVLHSRRVAEFFYAPAKIREGHAQQRNIFTICTEASGGRPFAGVGAA
jgi:hypothetical protein